MMEAKKLLGMGLVGEYSSRPKYFCPVCKHGLYTERSSRTGWNEWLFSEDGRRHYKTRCNLKGEMNDESNETG